MEGTGRVEPGGYDLAEDVFGKACQTAVGCRAPRGAKDVVGSASALQQLGAGRMTVAISLPQPSGRVPRRFVDPNGV